MIRVFFDHQIFSIATYGGVARYYCELVNHLNQSKDFRAEIYAGVHMNKFLHEFAFDCLKGIYLPRIPKLDKKSLRFRFNDYLTEKLYLKKTKPDILHKTLFDSQYQTPKDVINVISVYDMIHEKYQKITGKDPSRIEKQAVEQKRKAIQAADHVICISEQTKKDLLDLIEIHDSKVSVIYLGSDIKPAADGQNTIKDPFILYVGQRQGYKNFRTLLQAYCVNERLNKQFKLVCFGAGTIKKLNLEIRGTNPAGLDRVILIPSCSAIGSVGMAYTKNAKTVVPVTFRALKTPNAAAVTIVDNAA